MSASQVNLLSLWRSVSWEAARLSEAVERLPDACECGDPEAHLEGRCRCCGGHEPATIRQGSGENCVAILARLRADIMVLDKDFTALAGPLEAAALTMRSVELRRGVFLAANDLQRVFEAFQRVDHSVIGFRRTCATSELRGVKRHCAELREQCERINAELEEDGRDASTTTGRKT